MKKLIYILFLFLAFQLNAATYYISNAGTGSGVGTIGDPFQTMSELPALSPGDNVLFKRGDTFTESEINLTASGTVGNVITYSNYGTGALPVISGFQILGSWNNEGDGIYSASTTADNDLNMVSVDETNTAMGRYPNAETFNYFESHNAQTSITDNQLASSPDWDGYELVFYTSRWTLDRLPITSHSGNTITYSGTPSYEPRADNYGYFIQGGLQTLDAFGEWYISNGTFYMYFGAEDPTNHVVKVAAEENLFLVQDDDYIVFDGLAIEGYNNRVFDMYRIEHITIKNCSIQYSGNYVFYGGTNMGSQSPGLIVEDNYVNHTNDCVSRLLTEFEDYEFNRNTILNTGWLQGMGEVYTALSIYRANGGDFINNTIINTGYIPISFSGSNQLIQYNYIDNYCTIKDDGGGIYTYHGYYTSIPVTYFSNRVVRDNIVKNAIGIQAINASSVAIESEAQGIYMDGGSAYVDILNNTVSKCASGIFLNNPQHMTITGNLSYDNDYQFRINNFSAQDPTIDMDIQNNLYFKGSSDQYDFMYYVANLEGETALDDINGWGTVDNNTFNVTAANEDVVHITGAGGAYYNNFTEWQTYCNHEINSAEFVNTDYEVRENNSMVSITAFSDSSGTLVNGDTFADGVLLSAKGSTVAYNVTANEPTPSTTSGNGAVFNGKALIDEDGKWIMF